MTDSHQSKSIAAKLIALGQRPIPLTRRQALALGGVAAAAAGAGAVWHFKRIAVCNAMALVFWVPTHFDDEAELGRSQAEADLMRPLFTRKGTPARGEWLAVVDEPGETLNQYVRALAPAPRETTGPILILPFGTFDARLAAIVADVVALGGLFYGRGVTLLPIEPLPPLAADQRRGTGATEHLYSLALLDLLKPRAPPQAAAMLAMTPMDLTPGPGWNFVFGQASLVDRVGVWSLHRLAAREAPPQLQLRRVAQVALHELGHMFGMAHCTAYACCMNGSNSLMESDAAPLPFCPECDAKVRWRLHLEPKRRYARPAEFAAAKELVRDAELWAQCAKALEAG